jgi:hypothetical protein
VDSDGHRQARYRLRKRNILICFLFTKICILTSQSRLPLKHSSNASTRALHLPSDIFMH